MLLSYFSLVLLLSLLWKRLGGRHPATLFALYFTIILATLDAFIVGLAPVADQTRWTIFVGLAAFSLPSAILGRRGGRLTLKDPSAAVHPTRLTGTTRSKAKPPVRVLLWAVLLSSLIAIGFVQTEHAGFGLSLLDVRQATTVEALSQQDIGFGPLLLSLAPLVGALGVLLATRFQRRRWLLLVLLALGTVLPRADKTATLTVVVTVTTFYLLCRPSLPGVSLSRRIRQFRPALIVAAVIAASLLYFDGVNAALGKNITSLDLPSSLLPSAFVGPAVYELGGVSALSVAQSANIDPRVDSYGRSIYAVPWTMHLVDESFRKPQTIAQSVPIPIPFNVYTGFGDMWFDFGWLGVVILSSAFGAIVLIAYRCWRPGLYHWTVILSLLTGLMASMTISFRLFYIGTLFELAVGYVVFRHIAVADSVEVATAYGKHLVRRDAPSFSLATR